MIVESMKLNKKETAKAVNVSIDIIERDSAKKIAAISAAAVAAIAAITGTGYYGHKKYKHNKLQREKDNDIKKRQAAANYELLLAKQNWDNSSSLNRLLTKRP